MDTNAYGISQNAGQSPTSSIPITFGGIPMGSLPSGSSGHSSLQFVMLRSEQSSSSAGQMPKTLPRILPAPVSGSRPLLTLASNSSSGHSPSSTERVIHYKKFESVFSGTQNFNGPSASTEPVVAYIAGGTNVETNVSAPPGYRSLLSPRADPPMNNYLVTISNEVPVEQSTPKKRGRKRMTDEEKAAAKRKRERQKNQEYPSATKTGKRRGRKRRGKGNSVNKMGDFEKEMNEMRQKIHGRYDSKKKPVIRKEDVGYSGPYIRSYNLTEAEEGTVPMPNYIVDDLETHLGNPSGVPKSKFHFGKSSGVLPPQEPFVCHFCHFDPMAERETAAGDLIGPITLPVDISKSKMNGEPWQQAYFHEKCLEWSSNFRMVGFEIVDLPGLINDAKTVCSYCGRKGATIGCSAPLNCQKAFHYPCATLSDCRLVSASHQVFCEEHNCDRSPHRRA